MKLELETSGKAGDPTPPRLKIYADEEGFGELMDVLEDARDGEIGLSWRRVGSWEVHVFRSPPAVADDGDGPRTLIRGTHKLAELWPVLIGEVEKRDPAKAQMIRRLYAPSIAVLENREMWRLADAQAYKNVDFLVWEQMFDALNRVAPEGTYFGASVGDASDYGFHPAGDGS